MAHLGHNDKLLSREVELPDSVPEGPLGEAHGVNLRFPSVPSSTRVGRAVHSRWRYQRSVCRSHSCIHASEREYTL